MAVTLTETVDYAIIALRVGVILRRKSDKREVYFQPGDAEAGIREIADAINEHGDDRLKAHCAHVALSDYF